MTAANRDSKRAALEARRGRADALARPRPAAIIAALPISLAFSAATACSWPEQAFAAGGDNGNESFESRFLCTGTRLCYTIDLWRTDIHVLVYIIENRVRHVARDIQTAGFSQWLASLEEEKGGQSGPSGNSKSNGRRAQWGVGAYIRSIHGKGT